MVEADWERIHSCHRMAKAVLQSKKIMSFQRAGIKREKGHGKSHYGNTGKQWKSLVTDFYLGSKKFQNKIPAMKLKHTCFEKL